MKMINKIINYFSHLKCSLKQSSTLCLQRSVKKRSLYASNIISFGFVLMVKQFVVKSATSNSSNGRVNLADKLTATQSRNMCKKVPLRGALIVLEGCDRSGKTTQCKSLVKALEASGRQAKYINFPDRTTECGGLINSFLTNKKDFNDETIHLLFTLNRWEAKNQMEKLLLDGVTLIVDRYSYSGVAFSAAKGLDLEWCKAPEAGLLKPDLVLLLTMTAAAISERGGFGDERYEIPEFQQRVMKMFDQLKDDTYWTEIDADKSFNVLHDELLSHCNHAIDNIANDKLDKLW